MPGTLVNMARRGSLHSSKLPYEDYRCPQCMDEAVEAQSSEVTCLGCECRLFSEQPVLFATALSFILQAGTAVGLDPLLPKGDIKHRAGQHSLKCSCLVLS